MCLSVSDSAFITALWSAGSPGLLQRIEIDIGHFVKADAVSAAFGPVFRP